MVSVPIFHTRKLLRKAAPWEPLSSEELPLPTPLGVLSGLLLAAPCHRLPYHRGHMTPWEPTRAPPEHRQLGHDGHVMWRPRLCHWKRPKHREADLKQRPRRRTAPQEDAGLLGLAALRLGLATRAGQAPLLVLVPLTWVPTSC